MKAAAAREDWTSHLNKFTEMNKGRPTRIGLFEWSPDTMADRWLEDGLALEGIDAEIRDGKADVQIVLEGFEHVIRNAVKLSFHYGIDPVDDGVDITDANGNVTILRFETEPRP